MFPPSGCPTIIAHYQKEFREKWLEVERVFIGIIMAVLSDIWIYPVKSLQGLRLSNAVIDRRGFKWDRHWMLVDSDGLFVTQRQKPQMALFTVSLEHEHLLVSFPKKKDLQIELNQLTGQKLNVTVWQDSVNADLVGEKADQWFSDCLGETVRLVKMPDEVQRQVDQDYAKPDDQTGFSDGFPFLMLSRASIDDLNNRIDDKAQLMTVKRFRPNLVINGVEAYAEDNWHKITIGDINFRVVKPCSRCAITTVNPETAVKGSEPLLTLAKYRREGNKVFFGQNVIHDSEGVLRQGDPLSVLE